VLTRFLPQLESLDADLREAFLEKLRVRWTHTSTALEGNTLTEGETLGVLRYGLTVSGKPLAHHNEVLGHSRALDLLYSWMDDGHPVAEPDLHALHVAVQTSVEVDYLKPIGAWKCEPNSTLAKIGGKTAINDTYATPTDVPRLMQRWLGQLNHLRHDASVSALDAYAWSHATFVRIHPYADGNGRMARLLANLPVIEKGQLPILIPDSSRLQYIDALATWQFASGRVTRDGDLTGDAESFETFHFLCAAWMEESNSMLTETTRIQEARRAG
jgi:Fic family protein